ncbi:hypothetical protein [Psychromonas hadalis]|uniref:hypothetical protein n=1 Tax=Psychromonas hadalis TaxID=211669 RepID=UPI0003B4E5E7|nr:hypothetical protein [Psychromonas hadalis]
MTSSIASSLQNTLATSVNNSKSTQQTQTTKEVSDASSPVPNTDNKLGNGDSVNLSNRALKIQSIASEFFSGGGLSLQDIPNYIQRLQSDGFLTSEQAEKLGTSSSGNTTELGDSTVKIINFIDNFKNKVAENDSEDSLIAILNKAKNIIKDLGEMTGNTTVYEIKLTVLELNRYLESDEALQWDKQDIKSLKDISSILSVASQLNFSPSSSKATNRYLAFSGR